MIGRKGAAYERLSLHTGNFLQMGYIGATCQSVCGTGTHPRCRAVSSDILIGVAKEFKVSTDYILGLSTVSVRKSTIFLN